MKFIRPLIHFFFLISILGLQQLSFAQSRAGEAVLDINPYKITCIGEGRHPCTFGKMNGEKCTVDFDIQGFEFEWGFTYQLRIEYRDINPAPADGSSKEYRMKKLLKKEPVNADFSFEYTLEPKSDLFGFVSMVEDAGDDKLLLLGEKYIICNGQKNKILSILETAPVKLLLKFDNDKNLQLIEFVD